MRRPASLLARLLAALALAGSAAWVAPVARPCLAAEPAAAAAPAAPVTRRRGLIAAGTRWATPYFITESERPGPTVLITGGIHGNEPAGAHAAAHIRHWPVRRGTLIVVPRANAPGLAKNTRRMPGEPKGARDPNRNFPKTDGPDEAVGTLCNALWAFAREHSPDWHADLHEGYGYRGAGSKSAGSSIIICPDDETRAAQRLMRQAVNATITDDRKTLVLLRPPANGSLARACAQRLDAHAMICETTWRDDPTGRDKKKRQPLARRIRQHRLMVHTLLEHLEMAACGPDRMLPDRQAEGGPVAVAVYNGGGTTNRHYRRLEALLGRTGDIATRPLSPQGIRAEALAPFDAVIFPGGSGSKQARALGKDGRRRVRAFVRAGGGYVGICAGAYLATCRYKWSLEILDAYVMDREHWRRGTGVIQMEMTPAGRKLLGGRQGQMKIYYSNGPLLAAAGRENLPDFTSLAYYRSEVAKHGAPKGVMPDTPAIVTASFGRGRVIAFGPHPEKPRSEEGAEELLINAIRLCTETRREPARAEDPSAPVPVGQ